MRQVKSVADRRTSRSSKLHCSATLVEEWSEADWSESERERERKWDDIIINKELWNVWDVMLGLVWYRWDPYRWLLNMKKWERDGWGNGPPHAPTHDQHKQRTQRTQQQQQQPIIW